MESNQWLKLVEYGDHPHGEGIQRVTQEAAMEMQRKFRSLRARLARKFGGVPIYIGHPDDENFAHLPGHDDTRSYAWVQDIEARDDGIWILPKWSEAGEIMIRNSFFRFLSPRWEMKYEDGVLVPIRLISVGLTNHPNIPGDAIANQRDSDGEEIIETHSLQPKENIKTEDVEGEKILPESPENPKDSPENHTQLFRQIRGLLMELFSINLEQPFGEIKAALTVISEQARLWREEGEALKNGNKELLSESERFYKIACEKEEQMKMLSEQLEKEKVLSGEHFINFAIDRGLILPNESAQWKEKYIADPRGTSNELLSHSCPLNTTSKTEHLRSINYVGRDRILALVSDRMERYGENYNDAWNAIKKSHPALF
ncbi:MAG: phage protease [Puniceicoccales bacterium]|jgi:hypothetical protein|nr:phage protease [Puniceicoccales bacterium]